MSYVTETVESFLAQKAHLHDGVGFLVVDVDGSSNMSTPVYTLPDRTLEQCSSHSNYDDLRADKCFDTL